MKNHIFWTLRLLIILMATNLGATALVQGESAQVGDPRKDFGSIGAPGPNAINFKVWTNRSKGEGFLPGARAIIHLTTEQEAHVAILSVSSDGAITVVLPDELLPDTALQPGTIYTLFGDDSPIHLIVGEKAGKAKVIVYVSSTPLVLAPLKIPKGKRWLVIPPGAVQETGILYDKLVTMARDESFNRTAITFPNEAGADLEVRPQAVFRSFAPKRIPGGLESVPPETLTGAAGVKPPTAGDTKE